jgi:glycosyltransferase involved in cell wall biosynthesis
MNLLIITNYFPPEIRSASHLFYELSESFVSNGHKVTVVTGFPRENIKELPDKYKGKLFLREMMNGIQVLRVATMSFPRNIPVVRGLEQFLLSLQFLWGGLISGKQDVVLVYSPPLPLGLSVILLKKAKRIPFVFNMQDIYPQCIIDLGILKNPLLIKLFEGIEKFIYKKADYITVHSEGNREHVISRGIFPSKVVVLPNWVDTDMIAPSNRLNGFREENDLGDKFIVSYAGVMGYAQDLSTIIESAERLKIYENILFLLVGDGPMKKDLEQRVETLGLKNVKFLPMQPREKYPEVLAASDVGLVTLTREIVTPVVPAKLLSIMASGRPVVASMDLNGDAPKIIKASLCGYCVEPENPEMLAQAILKLYDETVLREELGRNGRKYAEEHFSRNVCIKIYEKLFEKVCTQNAAMSIESEGI